MVYGLFGQESESPEGQMQSPMNPENISELAQQVEQLRALVRNLESQLQQQSAQSSQAQGGASSLVHHNPMQSNNKFKVEKPNAFTGRADASQIDTFIFQCELYFAAMNINADGQRVAFATMLLAGDAAIWLQTKFTMQELTGMSWATLVTDLREQFKPIDFKRRARDILASCVQTGSMQGYINTFRQILVQCEDVSEPEAIDRFVRGLKNNSVKQFVLLASPSTFNEAALVADRVSSTSTNQASSSSSRFPTHLPKPPPRGDGPIPMELGALQAENSAGRNFQHVKCYRCGKMGHIARQCRVKNNNRGQGRP